MGGEKTDPKTVQFLQTNKGKGRYLVAVQSATAGEQLIIDTGEPVMALGGFIGSDPILTLPQLQQKVAAGEVRYFMFPAANSNELSRDLPPALKDMLERMGGGNPGNMMGGMMGGNGKIMSWVQHSCKVVPTAQWKTNDQQASSGLGAMGMGMNNQLYDCSGASAQ
ncbi:hypothetical protein KDW_22450 [Dictyobacter vulcani]|uniref:Putative mannosyltransferase YkcA/B-like C-terminal domain-containing protein n=1 Tax=Dictyobacter vulcani TaxID=2607529 RepID=A0A5J4KJZ8_9CHLR|nr:hypothetical protein [Dictyobacter vulcani]GER88083.1 hypothetical protein KDW_22450 [Dictyobacter vulcani]